MGAYFESGGHLHVYWRPHQPATRYRVHLGDESRLICHRRRQLARAFCCRRLRWMGHLTVQVYYDGVYFWCRRGHGCQG